MSILLNPNVRFEYAGLFTSVGDWIHPDRTEVTHEIIYVTDGEVLLDEEGAARRAVKGQLLVLEAGKRHVGTRTARGVSFYWLHFRTADMALPFSGRFFERFGSPHLFKELLHYSFLPSRPEEIVNVILVRILAELQYAGRVPDENADKTAAEIYEWLRVNASARLTAAQTARRFGFCADHISRLLKKQYGAGAKELIDAFLLARAKELLAGTGKYVKEIAYELDFASDKAFIGFFKYHEGVYPSEFRNRFYQIHMNNR